MNMLGVQPQAPHFTITYRLGVAQNSDEFQNVGGRTVHGEKIYFI